jgi:hypothetical protein
MEHANFSEHRQGGRVSRQRWRAPLVVAIAAATAALVTAGVFFSCDSGGGNASDLQGALVELGDDRDRYGSGMPTPDEVTFVGYGINIFDGPTFADALRAPLIKPEVYLDASARGGKGYSDSSPMNAIESTIAVRENLREVYSSLDVGAEDRIGRAIPYFSLRVSAQYGNKQELKSEAKFYNSIFSAVTKKQTLDPYYMFPGYLSQIIKPAYIELINEPSIRPETLFRNLGTHIILSSSIGGSVNISGIYNSDVAATEQEISEALNFRATNAGGAAGASLTQKHKDIAANTSIKTKAQGGDVGAFTGVQIAGVWDAMSRWGDSVAGAPTIAKIYQTIAIWELATDPGRKAVLENYFYANADAINVSLDGYFTKGVAQNNPGNGPGTEPSTEPGTEPSNEPIIVDGWTYRILNWHSRKALDNRNTDKDGNVHLWDAYYVDQQKWVAEESWAYPGWFSFKCVRSGKVLDVSRGNVNNNLVQYTRNGTDAQLFRVADFGDGSVVIYNRLANGIYKVSANGTEHNNGTLIVLRTGGGPEARWKLERVD